MKTSPLLFTLLAVPIAAAAGSFDGSSAANAGLSAAQILRDHPGSASGVYWIDPDGAGAMPAAQFYADMGTAGGGWMLVRRSAGSGNWIEVSDDLRGSASLRPELATDPLSSQSWTRPFGITASDFLFATGDLSTWGVLGAGDVYETVNGDQFAPNAVVKASFNTAVAAGGFTNVLNRNFTGTGAAEDPWIGFEGGHFANIPRMLYGEAGFGGAHVVFKNAHQGANVFVREINVPATPVPEPASVALLLAGLGVVAWRQAKSASSTTR